MIRNIAQHITLSRNPTFSWQSECNEASCKAPKVPPTAGRNFAQAVPGGALLCSLTTNYVCWMFLLVSSAHAIGCQEEKYEGETFWGEHEFVPHNLTDT